jgi:hypothetical protein
VPTWGVMLRELNALVAKEATGRAGAKPGDPSAYDVIRRKYLGELAQYTGRPVITYVSGWLEGRPAEPNDIGVATRDLMAFMEAVNGLPHGPLDLIIHSPGGDADAARAIMSYLRDEDFDPIRAIVPISAMSASTMMALSCDEILMAKHSQLGPIDPQFTVVTPDGPRSAPAQAILDQFEEAKKQCASAPQSIAAWLPILRSYLPGLLSQCLNAQSAAEDIVAEALCKHMFHDLPSAEAKEKAKRTASWFNDHKTHRSHGRPLRFRDLQAEAPDVKVTLLEDDSELQEKVLSAWHSIQLTLSQLPVKKMVENHMGKAWVLSGSVQVKLNPAIAIPSAPRQPTNPFQQKGKKR